jgi:hypothetical protein
MFKRKKRKLTLKLQHWLVSVSGYDSNYTPSRSAVTKIIQLPKKETPVDWFLLGPKVYCRFEFVPDTLIGFWPLTAEQASGAGRFSPAYAGPQKSH